MHWTEYLEGALSCGQDLRELRLKWLIAASARAYKVFHIV